MTREVRFVGGRDHGTVRSMREPLPKMIEGSQPMALADAREPPTLAKIFAQAPDLYRLRRVARSKDGDSIEVPFYVLDGLMFDPADPLEVEAVDLDLDAEFARAGLRHNP